MTRGRTKVVFSILIFFFFCLFLFLRSHGQVQEKQKVSEFFIRSQILKTELELASKPLLYFLLNLEEKRLLLKARGMVLKEWQLEKIKRWGPHPPMKILSLEKKTALFAPKRKKIKPGEIQNPGRFELEALELKDMPTIYTLRFSDGLKIYVRPNWKTLPGYLARIGFFLRWYGWFPLQSLFFKIKGKPAMLLEVTTFSQEDAKAIYWGLLEGIKGLIFSLPEPK